MEGTFCILAAGARGHCDIRPRGGRPDAGLFHSYGSWSVGTFAVLVLTLIKRDMDLKRFVKAISETLRIACMVLMLIAGATILGHFFAVTRTPYIVATGWGAWRCIA